MTDDLRELKAQRDALNDRIKLIEDAIKRAAYDACMNSQLVLINDSRASEGKKPLTRSQWFAGTAE